MQSSVRSQDDKSREILSSLYPQNPMPVGMPGSLTFVKDPVEQNIRKCFATLPDNQPDVPPWFIDGIHDITWQRRREGKSW